jgi:hypothetical protein
VTVGLKEVLYPVLLNDGGISAIVDTRIYPGRLPEGADLPAISFFRVSTQRMYTHDQYDDPNQSAWAVARVQINCFAKTEEGADALGEAVLFCLSGYGSTIGGEMIGSVMADNDFDVYDSDVEIFRRIMDFKVSYDDAIQVSS